MTTDPILDRWVEGMGIDRGNGTPERDVSESLRTLAQALAAAQRDAESIEVRLMALRHRLGLPLLERRPISHYPLDKRSQFESGFRDIVVEVATAAADQGRLLEAHQLLKTVGELDPLSRVFERRTRDDLLESYDGEALEALARMAFHGGVHPLRGFELLLHSGGTCDAITSLEGPFPGTARERTDCVRLLVSHFHAELRDAIARVFQKEEEPFDPNATMAQLLDGRPWLFKRGCHVDDAHLQAVLRISSSLPIAPETRALFEEVVELTEYGCRLPQTMQHQEAPPFEDFYASYQCFYRALLDIEREAGLAYFVSQAQQSSFAAEIAVLLLQRCGRSEQALQLWNQHLRHANGTLAAAPSLWELCQELGDTSLLQEVGRERSDLFMIVAGVLGGDR